MLGMPHACLLIKPIVEIASGQTSEMVNGGTKPHSYPLPRMEDCVDHAGGCRVCLPKFDLLKGYWQAPFTEHAKEVSAFVTPDDFLQ